jgi:hypothetical protein
MARIFARRPLHSGIRLCPYRPLEFVILGTTDAAHKMVCHFRHRHTLGQSERRWFNIEVTHRPVGRAFDLKGVPFLVRCPRVTGREGRGDRRRLLALFRSCSNSMSSGSLAIRRASFSASSSVSRLSEKAMASGGCPYTWASQQQQRQQGGLFCDELLHSGMSQHALGLEVLHPHPQLRPKPLSSALPQPLQRRLGNRYNSCRIPGDLGSWLPVRERSIDHGARPARLVSSRTHLVFPGRGSRKVGTAPRIARDARPSASAHQRAS